MDQFAEINSLLGTANQAILGRRAADALAPLRTAYPLLAARVASKTSFSAIVAIQAGLMSMLAGDPNLAREYIVLLADEVGQELERLGNRFAEQVKTEDRQGARHTEIVAYTYAVSFVPFVKGARLANLLQGDPTQSSSPEVAAIGRIQEHVRPQLDALQWESWGYPPEIEHLARYWAAYALVRWAQAMMDNRDSGDDARISQELAISIQQLIADFPEDQLGADYWNLSARIFFAYGESHYHDGLNAMEQAARICKQLGNEADAARDYSGIGALEIERAGFLRSNGKSAEADQTRASAERHLIEARDTLLRLNEYEAFIAASVNLEALYSQQERWTEAEKVFQQAWEKVPCTGDQRVYVAPQIAGNFGSTLYDHGRTEEAEKWLRAAVKDVEAVRSRDPEVFQVVNGTLGRLLASSGRTEEGYGYLKQAVEHLESYRTSFVAERSNSELLKRYRWVYEALIDCCVTLGEKQPERRTEAYELAELSKWRTFTVPLSAARAIGRAPRTSGERRIGAAPSRHHRSGQAGGLGTGSARDLRTPG